MPTIDDPNERVIKALYQMPLEQLKQTYESVARVYSERMPPSLRVTEDQGKVLKERLADLNQTKPEPEPKAEAEWFRLSSVESVPVFSQEDTYLLSALGVSASNPIGKPVQTHTR